VATVAALPPSWSGSFASIGNAETHAEALREETVAPAEQNNTSHAVPQGHVVARDIEFEIEDAK
jgi:hypothetical protein